MLLGSRFKKVFDALFVFHVFSYVEYMLFGLRCKEVIDALLVFLIRFCIFRFEICLPHK